MTQINVRLRHIRRQKNMSQEELARRLGVSRQAIIAIEQGTSLPSLPVILSMLRELDIPFETLFDAHWSPFRLSNDEPNETSSHLGFTRDMESAHAIPIHLIETESSFLLTAELAGVHEEDVTVDLSQQHVLILATKRERLAHDTLTVHTQEIHFGPLLRIISLPAPVETDRAQAAFKRGMLLLTLPKFLPETKRRITFQPETIYGKDDTLIAKEDEHGSK